VAWGNGRYVCVGASGTMVTSTNGAAWEGITLPSQKDLFGITYGGGKFVAVGAGGTVLISSNGLDWHVVPAVTTNQLNTVGFGGGRFVAAGKSRTLLVSTDAVSWSQVNAGIVGDLAGIAYGNGTFVVVGSQNYNPQIVLTSTNGLTWSDWTASQHGVAAYGVAYGKNVFLELDARSQVYASTDGIAWKQAAFGAGGSGTYLYGITWAQDYFVAVGGAFSGPSRKIVSSSDGSGWRLCLTNSAAPGLRAVGYGNGYFLVVGKSGHILQSDPIFALNSVGLSGDGMDLELTGEIGRTYILQGLADAAQSNWEDVLTFTNTTETVPVRDTGAGSNSTRLYRALSR
jgi:hypothetical protein